MKYLRKHLGRVYLLPGLIDGCNLAKRFEARANRLGDQWDNSSKQVLHFGKVDKMLGMTRELTQIYSSSRNKREQPKVDEK